MDSSQLYQRYQDLQRYVGWSDADAARVARLLPLIRPVFGELVDDFYAEIQRHPVTAGVLSGGASQIERLKGSLLSWLEQLLGGTYDRGYVDCRWRVGMRHVEIGVEQAYTNAAMSRMRSRMTRRVIASVTGDPEELAQSIESLHRLLDSDLAIIEEAYEMEHLRRQRGAERSRMEAALHQEREFAGRLIERAQAIVLLLDLQGVIVRFNPYFETLTGFRLDELRGKNWFDVCLPHGDRDRLEQVFVDVLGDVDTTGTINRIVTKDGRLRLISWSNATLKNVDGETTAVLAIGQDITELEQAQQRVLQAERLAAIGQMITGLAHESRNALQRIQACAEMLELEVEENDEAMDLVRRIQAAQDHMHRLFEEVRGYAAPIQLERGKVRLNEAWRDAWEQLAEQRGDREVELREESESLDLLIQGDHFRLVQVFRNLLENALAACTDPTRITIRCRPEKLGEEPAVRVVVHDNGPGLDPAQRDRIFEPFFTTKTKGTGLGMSIAQRIVDAHGGTLSVAGGDGPGARIVITLPRGGS